MGADERLKRAGVMTRVIRAGEDDGMFDARFWAQLSPEERFAAAWQATLDWARIKGIDERELRLQRSVVRIERR